MKIVINSCHGGFGLSKKAIKRYLELKGKDCFFYEHDTTKYDYKEKIYVKIPISSETSLSFCVTKDFGNIIKLSESKQDKLYREFWNDFYFSDRGIPRDDLDLIKVINELGNEASGSCAKLEVIEIPEGINWEINEYDGFETIHEVHRSWP